MSMLYLHCCDEIIDSDYVTDLFYVDDQDFCYEHAVEYIMKRDDCSEHIAMVTLEEYYC